MQIETPITPEWLAERGELNDAQVLSVKITRDRIVICLDDEWANEHGEPGYPGETPLALIISGDPSISQLDTGVLREKIYEVKIEDEGSERSRLKIVTYGQFAAVCSGSSLGGGRN